MNSLYAEVTRTILEQLEAGVTPWRKDWRSMPSSGIPYNVASSRP
jgi:antirestriction protein ArdC